MQAKFRLKLGQDEFELNFDVKDEKDFFEQVSFYSNLPKTGPSGSDDLKIVFRTTKEGHKYYSLVSEKEKMEFKLGQNKEAQGGGLFPKGWEPLYQGKDSNDGQQTSAPAPAFGQQAAPAQNAAFPGMVNPTTGPTAQTAAPAPAFGAGQMPVPQTVTPPAATQAPAAAPAAAPAQAAPTPQVAQVATNVLARFGIQKQ